MITDDEKDSKACELAIKLYAERIGVSEAYVVKLLEADMNLDFATAVVNHNSELQQVIQDKGVFATTMKSSLEQSKK